MPVALEDAAHREWLDPGIEDADRLLKLVREHVLSVQLVHYPVRTLVNHSRAEGPELIEPIAGAPQDH